MKKKILLLSSLLTLLYSTGFSQKIYLEQFNSPKYGSMEYELISFTKLNIYSAIFFAFTDRNTYNQFRQQLIQCKSLEKINAQAYLLLLEGKQNEQAEKFQEAIKVILSRRKMLDSRLFLVDQNGSTLGYQALAAAGKAQPIQQVWALADFRALNCDAMKEKVK